MWHKLYALCEEKWFLLPTLSALLFILSFHPFDLWALCFVALAPLFYYVAAYPRRPRWEVFWGGFLTGGLFALSLSYFTVIQFHWLPEAYLFADMVRFSFIPIALGGGIFCGIACSCLSLLYGKNIFVNILISAATYTSFELALFYLCGGYFFAMLAYIVTPLVPLMTFAGLGGAFLVSFIVALVNSGIAWGLMTLPRRKKEFVTAVGILIAVFVLLFAGEKLYLFLNQGPVVRTLSVATIQAGSETGVGFGTQQNGTFSLPELGRDLTEAGRGSPDLIIYPFSPVEGAIYAGQKDIFNKNILITSQQTLGDWVGQYVPASTTVMLWTTLYEDQRFYNVFQFWQHGDLVSQYEKQHLFPFIDYTPRWAANVGFYSTSIDEAVGPPGQHISFDGIAAGGMLCSEIHQPALARAEAGDSSLIISAGSEATFSDDEASVYSLEAAQYRAAENNLPLIRSNILGPSGIVRSDGSLIAEATRGKVTVLRGTIPLRRPNPTLYSRLGNIPMIALILAIFGTALWVKRRERSAQA